MSIIPTYDPQDYGNKPGDGPLRVGGVPASDLPVTDNDLPSTMCKAAKEQAADLEMVRDLALGASQVRRRGRAYLPQAPGEKANEYNERLARSTFYNVLGHTITGLVGFVFRRDIVLGDDVPEPIKKHWENIDNAGTHGDVFSRDTFKDNITAGHCAILVDFPKTDGTQTYADEVRGEIRPYWVPIKKEQVLSWDFALENGRRVLTQVVLQEKVRVKKGRFGEQEQVQYRVFYRENGVVGYQLLQITDDKKLIEVEAGTYPTQDEIPIAEITSSGSLAPFESAPPLLDVAHLNVQHYQVSSDYFHSIYKTCVPILFGAGITSNMPQDPTQPQTEVVVGPNSGVMVPDTNAKLMYVSHDGGALDETRAALDGIEARMATLGLTMLAPQKRAAETAEAKRIDKSTSDSALAISARGLEDGIERALGFHARYMRLDTGGSVTVNRDYENLALTSQQIAALSAMVEKGQLTVETLWSMLLEGNVLPAEFDADDEKAALAAEAEIKREMALELQAQGEGQPNGGPPKPGQPAQMDEAA